jgi:hypothetical protein
VTGTVHVRSALDEAVAAWRAAGSGQPFVPWLADQDWSAERGPAWGFGARAVGAATLVVDGGSVVDAGTVEVLELLDDQLAEDDDVVATDARRGVLDHLSPVRTSGVNLPADLAERIGDAHDRMLRAVRSSGVEVVGDAALLEWPSGDPAPLTDSRAGELVAAVVHAAVTASQSRGGAAATQPPVDETGSRDLLREVGRRFVRRTSRRDTT